MTEFTVKRTSEKSAVWDVDGDMLVGQIRATSKLYMFAGKHGIAAGELLDAARAAPIEAEKPKKAEEEAEEAEPIEFRVRPIHGKQDTIKRVVHHDPIEGFRTALELYSDCESVIDWKGIDRLAMLDVDYHHCSPPERHRAEALLAGLRPVPAIRWVSHGGGLHAFYHAQSGLTAEEIAACAAINIKAASPQCSAEVITITRHPYHGRTKNGEWQTCSDLTYAPQSLDAMVSQWKGSDEDEVSEEDVQEWLLNRGMSMDARYGHKSCPFDPCESPGNPPVLVSDTGIYCFRCAGTGHQSGGFALWSKLIKGRSVNRIVEAVKRFVPWDHAKFIVYEDYGERIAPKLLRLVYTALAKAIHGADHPNIWRIRDDYQCVRSAANTWLDSGTLEAITPPPKPGRLQEMPSCRKAWKDETGQWQNYPDAKEVDKHATNQPLKGWPGLIPVRGTKLWGRYLPYGDRKYVRGLIHGDDESWPRPKYLPAGASRLSEEECERHIDKCFPEINLDYLRLLLVARGYAESGTGKVPILLATGPSGSGKTLTALLAASILGDAIVRVPKGNYQETVGYSSYRGGFLLLDEFAKGASGARLRNKFDFLLEIDRDFTFRQLYVGAVTTRINNVILLTNNAYGEEVMEHEQFGRRAVYVDLTRKPDADWSQTCGTGDVRFWRRDPHNQRVADSFLSYIVDDFFADISAAKKGQLLFTDAAAELGFRLLQDSRERHVFEGMDVDEIIRDFFKAVCNCPDAGDRVAKYKGKGWKEFLIAETDHEAAKIWRELCDDAGDKDGRGSSIKIAERDLSKVLGITLDKSHETVKFFCRRMGKYLLCKFQHQWGRRKQDWRANADIETDFNVARARKGD